MSDRWPALLSRELAAEYLGVSLTTFKRMIADGVISTVLIRDMPRYKRSDLDAYIDDLPNGNSSAAIASRSRRLNGKSKITGIDHV